jgi:tetratricopeptide (TPR) repeat protein
LTRAARAGALAAIAVTLGCGGGVASSPAFDRLFAEGERAEHAGRHEDAAVTFERAAALGPRVKDRDEALYLAARSRERGGDYPRAQATLRSLEGVSPKGPRAARAAFDDAEIELEHGDAAKGRAMLEVAARANPTSGNARPALERLVREIEQGSGARAALGWITTESAAFRGTEQEEVCAYLVALELDHASDAAAAHDAYLSTARRWPYPRGAFTDAALERAADLDVARGRPAEAIEHLREMLRAREKSDTIGSYERPHYAEAQLEIGEIYRDKLGDPAAARREFRRLFDDFPTSRLRDDALWAEARVAQKQGDEPGACDAASKLVRDLPDSRYAACARLVCPTAPEATSKRPCADYIERDLR